MVIERSPQQGLSICRFNAYRQFLEDSHNAGGESPTLADLLLLDEKSIVASAGGGLGTTMQGQNDTDSFAYDWHTGRLTQYTFNVNGQTDAGTLTWNPNGSLQQLAIVDAVPGTIDGQVCNYTHDDLGRVASANCGAPWSQSFSYDPFGNIKKSGSVTFQPTYSTTSPNNQIISAGYNYDANGNLLTDATGGHNYSWDAEGRPVTIDGVSLTYDSVGRMVEQVRNGDVNCTTASDCTQMVYGPGGGKLALMNGQTLNKAFIPLPGGDTAVYTSSGLAYYRHTDWLGSSRLDSTPARSMFSATAYAPFGESYDGSGTTDLSFTGQNQDTVPGLYDFMFREYSPNQGRWISPDPAALDAVDPTDPQSWNRYGYVANTPLNAADPLGLFIVDCVIDWCPYNVGGSGNGYGGGFVPSVVFNTISAGNPDFGNGESEARYLSYVPWYKVSGNHLLVNLGHTLIYTADGKSIIDQVR